MFLFLALVGAVYDPVVVDDSTFESVIGAAPVAFVMVTKDDVSFSADILPKFRAVAEVMKDECLFACLDFDKSPEARKRFGIFAIPSFFVFRHGVLSLEYPFERDSKTMLAYLKRITGPGVVELATSRDVLDFKAREKTCVILAGDEVEADIVKDFEWVASNLTDVAAFAWAKTAEAVQQLGVEELPSLQLHRAVDRTVVDFPLAFGANRESLRKWVIENLVPRYQEKNAIIFRDLGFERRYTLMAFVDTSKKASLDLMHETLGRVYDEYGRNFTYVYSDVYDVGSIILGLGFTGAREPLYCFVSLPGGEIKEKYLFPEKRRPTPENVMKWVKSFVNGSMKPKVQSEPEVPGQTGPLRKIVGTQFLNETRNVRNDVVTLVLLGDNAAHRSRAMAVINETAIEFARQKVKSVNFNYIDADLNELPGLSTKNMNQSTFLFWSGKDRNVIAVPGNSDVLALMNAILRYSKTRPRFKIPVKYDEAALEL